MECRYQGQGSPAFYGGKMNAHRTIEQLTAFLVRAGINPSGYGERMGEAREAHVFRILAVRPDVATHELERIIAEDKATRWPAIEAERRKK